MSEQNDQALTSQVMRKQPRQVRSQQRVDTILMAAAALFDEPGYDATTTNAIAARAGVPIGSLYQFFPNKEAIKEAIIQRYGEGMRAVLMYDPSLTAVEVLEAFVDKFMEYEAAHTGFRSLFTASDGETSMYEEIVRRVEGMIGHYFPALIPDYLHQSAVVMVALVKVMLPLMTPSRHHLPQNLPPEQVKTELKLVMKGYLRGVLLRVKHPLPPGLD